MDYIQIYGKHLDDIFISTLIEDRKMIYTYIEKDGKEIKVELEKADFETEIKRGKYIPFIKRHADKINEIIREEFNSSEEVDILDFMACITYQALSILPSILNQSEYIFDKLY